MTELRLLILLSYTCEAMAALATAFVLYVLWLSLSVGAAPWAVALLVGITAFNVAMGYGMIRDGTRIRRELRTLLRAMRR
jgi:hypothetical protein